MLAEMASRAGFVYMVKGQKIAHAPSLAEANDKTTGGR